MRWLCFAALLRATPLARAAAGGQHSVFIDGEGRLVVRHGSGGRGGRGEKKDEDEEVEFRAFSATARACCSLRREEGAVD